MPSYARHFAQKKGAGGAPTPTIAPVMSGRRNGDAEACREKSVMRPRFSANALTSG